MRHPAFLLASSAALISVMAIILALVGTRGMETFYIVAIAALISVGAATRAVRAFRSAAR